MGDRSAARILRDALLLAAVEQLVACRSKAGTARASPASTMLSAPVWTQRDTFPGWGWSITGDLAREQCLRAGCLRGDRDHHHFSTSLEYPLWPTILVRTQHHPHVGRELLDDEGPSRCGPPRGVFLVLVFLRLLRAMLTRQARLLCDSEVLPQREIGFAQPELHGSRVERAGSRHAPLRSHLRWVSARLPENTTSSAVSGGRRGT